MKKTFIIIVSIAIFGIGTTMFVSCSKEENEIAPRQKNAVSTFEALENVSTEPFAMELATAILENPQIIEEIHKGVSRVVEYGLDENLTFFDVLNTEQSVFFNLENNFEYLRNALEKNDILNELGFDASNYYDNLNIYWGRHDEWENNNFSRRFSGRSTGKRIMRLV